MNHFEAKSNDPKQQSIIRREQLLRVQEKTAGGRRKRTAPSPEDAEAQKNLEAEVAPKLNVQATTCAILVEYLKSQNIPTSGVRKLELLQRAAVRLRQVESDPEARPLATDYIDDDGDLDQSDDEMEEDEDE